VSTASKGIEDFEEIFRRDPSDVDAFAALQRAYRETGQAAELAAIMERRAGHLRDGPKAADLLCRAAEIHAQRSDTVAEARLLTKALELHRSNRPALDRLRQVAESQRNWTEVLRILALESEALVAAGGDNRRLARIEHETGRIWEQQFHRLDRAILHYQAAFKVDPSHIESIEAGRQIYRGVGRWKTVAALYQVELSTCSDPKRKVLLLLELGQLQWNKLGDLEGAARSYQEASQLRAGDEELLESLGEIYASPEWPTPGGLDKAASIFMQIAQTRQTRGDRDSAIAYLRRALGSDPENEAAYNRLEKAYEETGRWEDLDRLYRQRLSVATEMEQVELLMRRGELLERKLGDRKGARECYESVLAHEPLGGPASNRLIQLHRADKDFDALIALHQRALDGTQDRATRIRLMMEMATIYREHMGDLEAAAHLLHEVLQLEPDHRKALSAYEDYFRQKGDYQNLAELLRFAAQSAGQAGAPTMEVCARLEEMADVSERHLGDLEGAIESWQQIARLHPDVQRSKEALGRLGAKLRMWQGMVNVLERELAQAVNPAQRLQCLHRMAQVYYDKKADPQRTITILREALDHSPHDESSLRMLTDLYERENDFEGLAWALGRKLDGIMTKAERVNVLRRLGEIYADKLERPKDALHALGGLLELSPSDSKTHDRIQAILEKTEDLEGLARALELRSQASRSIGERLEALKDLARLMDDQLDDPARAAAYWEEVRSLDPEDAEALESLSRLYDRMGRARDLLEVLGPRLELVQDGGSPAQVVTILRQMAQVADERLSGQEEQAVVAYERLVELLPGDREATEALARLYGRMDRHADLVEILGRQIDLCDDPEQRVVLAFKQADVLEEKLSNLEGAGQVYEKIIEDYAPGDLDAHRRLKHLYRKCGDHTSSCEIAERELFLTAPDAADRLSLSLEIASMWRESVHDDTRAMLAYERVLELSPDNAEALLALRRLYHRVGAYHKLVKLAPTLFASVPDAQERLVLLLEMGQVYEENLKEPELSFEWYRRAHDLYPDDPTAVQNLQRLAREYGLWEELIAALLEARKRARGPQEQIALTRQVVQICRDELGDPARAFQALQQTLRADPTGKLVLSELEQLADSCGQQADLLEIYDRVIQSVRDDPHWQEELIRRRAAVAEHKLGDPAEALNDMLRLYALADEQQAHVLVPEIERLARLGDQWERAIEIHSRRFHDAETDDERMQILLHVSQLLEHEVGDLARAFMVQLQGFGLRPDDPVTLNNLWRLARTLQQATASPKEQDVEEMNLDDVQELELGDALVIESIGSRKRRDTTIDDPTLLDGGRPPPPPGRRHPGPPPPPVPVHQAAEQRRGFAPMPPPGFSPWDELARAYLALAPPDAATRIQHLLAVARIWREGAGNLDRAVATLVDAAAVDIEHPDLEQALLELGGPPYDRFDQLVQIYSDALERAADATSLIRLNIKLGDLLTQHQRLDQAVRHFTAVQAIAPTHREAASRLRDLYRSAGRWQELAALLARQLDLLYEALSPEERFASLQELADLYQHTLERPIEATEYLARLATEAPHELQILVRLADLYEELSIWAKQIETLEMVVDLCDQPGPRVGYLLRIAQTHDRELELPDRAIETYQRLLGEQPHNTVALDALERLYEAHERPRELLAVLRLELELAEGDAEAMRTQLLKLARALERQGEPEEARLYLQQARGLGPRDPDIEEALARILVQTGRPDEAVDLIRGQIQSARDERRPTDEILALLIRLARLQHNQLDDPGSARATLEQALALDAQNAETLSALSHHFLTQQTWPDYVETLARLAEVTPPEDPALVPTLMTAAATVREQAGDRDGAIRLGELVLLREPAHLPAVDLLIDLCDRDPVRQEPFLRLKHDLVDDPHQRAETLTRLGRALHQRGAPAGEVAAAYNEALSLDPDLVQAIDALSELFVSRGELEPARALLVDAIGRLGLSRDTGPLYLRVGEIFERQGQDEDGYRYLMDALRLDSKNLHLRMAVGQNRFRAERWREALRHLQEVEEHPDIRQHPIDAAEALFNAGRCEVNLRRADRAEQYYAAALELNPEHAPALHELAQICIDNGEWERAAAHLECEIPLSDDPAPRLKMLGDLRRDRLANVKGAASCYVRLLDLLPDEEATWLETLPRILPTLREAGEHEAAARAAETLAQVMWGEREKRDLLITAAEERRACGTPEAMDLARGHYEAALALDPGCLQAAVVLSELLASDEAVAELLRRVLATAAPQGPDGQPVAPLSGDDPSLHAKSLARLHTRLGQVLDHMGQAPEAIASLEQSLALQESVAVRETLTRLYGETPDRRQAALANHRRLLELEPWRADSLLELARASAGSAPYRTYCLYQALQTLECIDEQGVTFLASYTPPALDVEQSYAGDIGDTERWELVSLPEVQALRDVFATLWEAAPALFSRDLATYGISPEQRMSPMDDSNLAKVYSAVARALGIKQTVVYLDTAHGIADELRVVCMAPPAVIVSEERSAGRNVTELRFLLGRALELTQPAYILAAGLERADFARLLSSVLRAFHPRHMRGRREMGEEAMDQAARLRRNLPFKVARKLGEAFRSQAHAQFDSGSWRRAIQISANRVGLALCGDLGTALRLVRDDNPALADVPVRELVQRSPEVRDLLAFAVSDAYYATRVKLGLAGKGA